MFSKILVVNRGEIALRIMRTAKELGASTVAIYSEADAHSTHMIQADESCCVGPGPAAESSARSTRESPRPAGRGDRAWCPEAYQKIFESPLTTRVCAPGAAMLSSPMPCPAPVTM